MDCVFCKIIKGELPSYKVYEDDYALGLLDISPVSPGHTLIVSKVHYANLEDIPETELKNLMSAVKKVGQAIKNGLGAEGYSLSVNNDPVAGQVIPHLHFHVIPRKKGDGLSLWPQGKYAEGEVEAVLEKIKKSIN